MIRALTLIAALSACTPSQERRDDVAGQLSAWVNTQHNYIPVDEAGITAALMRMK
jgi:hypothetical protein